MSDSLRIGDRELIPLKDVGTIVPYSRDYVARLARDGKIAAAQINRQWYIDILSLKSFFEHAQLEMQARTEHTRSLRKQELDLHEWWAAFEANQDIKKQERPKRVLRNTVVVIILGIFVGLILVRTAPVASPSGILALLESYPLMASVISPYKESIIDSEGLPVWYEAGEVVTEYTSIDMSEGILLLPNTATSGEAVAASELFSDPVVYEETSSTTGIMRLQNSSTTLPVVNIPAGTKANIEPEESNGDSP